jgi:integrase/recombinase XerD
MNTIPCLIRSSNAAGKDRFALGDPLVDSYLEFVAGRSRPNTLRAVAHDLRTFFGVVGKDPVEVVGADIFDFIAAQRGDRTVVRIADRESGLSARTIARRLSSISGFYAFLVARGDTLVASNPVPRGLSTRRRGGKRREVPLVRVPRTLPKILSPAEVTALLGALRTHRDRAMVHAMVLGGLRRCEVLGLRLGDIQVPERSLFIAEGKGGHQRVIPISNTFFASVGDYLRHERPGDCDTDRVFVTLKGPNRGRAMTPDGVDKILQAATDHLPVTALGRGRRPDAAPVRPLDHHRDRHHARG